MAAPTERLLASARGREPAGDPSGGVSTAEVQAAGGGGSGGGPAAEATPLPLPPSWPSSKDCSYASCYCEENVYWLCQRLLQELHSLVQQVYAVFVSNASKLVPLWCQRAAASADAPVFWDYHVFLVVQPQGARPPLVFDLDSTLPFPTPLTEYSRLALLGGDRLPPQFRRQYRVVPGQLFLRHFASDRSHMRDAAGSWMQPPPNWPCITAADGSRHTLPAYLAFPPLPEEQQEKEQEQQLGQVQRQGSTAGGSVDGGDVLAVRAASAGGMAAAKAGQLEEQQFGCVLSESEFLALFVVHG